MTDVIVVGAGMSGLSALAELAGSGLNVICLEARDRIGGRVLTLHDPDCPLPIELGPEFIHGRPAEIWNLIRAGRLCAYDCEEQAVQIRKGEPQQLGDPWEQMDAVNTAMEDVERSGKDTTFQEFISKSSFPPEVRENATNFVEGFNAAHKETVSVASLAQEHRAAQAIEGERSFRVRNGYSSVAEILARTGDIRLHHIVERLEWSKGEVTMRTRHALTGKHRDMVARQAILTLPLGVLQAGAVTFHPEPGRVLVAADKLRFGHVARVVMRFREPWWEKTKHLADAGFWLSQEEYFPTWWTALPMRVPLLVGWSAAGRADRLNGKTQQEILQLALRDLARITKADTKMLADQLATAYFHDWANDPFARGAYSYVPAGAVEQRRVLAEPIEGTLFFAGEATETEGHSATVHGAIATGRRAAHQLMQAAGRPGARSTLA